MFAFVSPLPFLATTSSSSRCQRCHIRRPTPRLSATPPPQPSENGKDSDIDWNESWSRFRSSGMVSDAPSGRAPPTEAEKAKRKAKATLDNVQSSLPTWQMLSGDWRFWLGLVFVLSLFTAYINSTYTGLPPAGVSGGGGVI